MTNRRYRAAVCLIAIGFVTTPVAAAAVDWPVRRVVVAAPRDFRVDPESLFVEQLPEYAERGETGSAMEAALSTLAAEPEVMLLDTARSKESGDADQDFVIRGMLHLGIEHYRSIRLEQAIGILESAIEMARSSWLDALNPELVSELYLYLGLCRLETGKPDLAHIALKNVFLHDPSRRFRSGWFPVREEGALRAAALDFVESTIRENPLETTERMAGFLDSIGADVLVYMYLAPSREGEVLLETRVFEKGVAAGDRIDVSRDSRLWRGPDSASAAVSAWLACADLPSRTDTLRRLPRLFLDTSFSYSIFGTDGTTRTGFHNLGLSAGLAYQIQPGLDTFMKVNVYNSLEDRYGDLLDNFWSIRVAMGVGYSAVFSWGRAYTHFGFEMDYLSGFRSSTDPRCKLWPDDPDLCLSSDVRDPSFLFGGTAAVGVNVFLSRSVFMTIQVGFSGYFASSGGLTDLNFPFFTDIGFGYAFF